jgi:hypothetical protein
MTAEFMGGPLDGAKIDVQTPEAVYYYPVVPLDAYAHRHRYEYDEARKCYQYKGAEA